MTRQEVIDLLIHFHLIPKPNNDRRVVVQLGKAGDILNILPAIRQMSCECGERVNIMVANDYRDLVVGLSYVHPHIFEGHFFNDLNDAIRLAESEFDEVLVSQVTGKDYHYARVEQSFNIEAWRRIGMKPHFDSAKLVLDNRNFEYE